MSSPANSIGNINTTGGVRVTQKNIVPAHEAENNALKAKNHALKEENHALRAENDALKIRIAVMMQPVMMPPVMMPPPHMTMPPVSEDNDIDDNDDEKMNVCAGMVKRKQCDDNSDSDSHSCHSCKSESVASDSTVYKLLTGSLAVMEFVGDESGDESGDEFTEPPAKKQRK
eukprot:CAMPEP_0202728826 /NCGR_PEP_ID=MMETSP1385-20130828/185824_1 /ASSEMBLY_ACC=CAM_ASM_000861 /TAXON_ID=933848 /ORGANISM="Elphidium margaritaceum" /LENGTH=171 /DNA_ID=CAMNT_0049395077 /DNA_START=24 /DNA_END=539 /DNA_ORIENTATION=+